jgi:hypothetical protein
MKPKKYISADKNSSFVRNVMGRNVENISYMTADEELIFAQLSGASENNELEELLRLLQMLASVLEGGWNTGNYKSETYIMNHLRIMFESRRVMLSQDSLYQQLQNIYNEVVDKIENKNVNDISKSEFFEKIQNEILDCKSELNRRALSIRNFHTADKVTTNFTAEDKKIIPHYRRNINISEGNLSVNTINYNMFNMLRRNRGLTEQLKNNYFFRESLAVYSKKNQRKYQFRQQITNFLEKLTPNQQSFILEFAKNEKLLSFEKNIALEEKNTDIYSVFKNASDREIRQLFSRLKKLSERKIIEKELTRVSETEKEKTIIKEWENQTREHFLDVIGNIFSTNDKAEFYELFSKENIADFTESERITREKIMPLVEGIKELLDEKKSRDMVKTVSRMNDDTLIAYSDSIMNHIQNSEINFMEKTLDLEENLESIYYSGNFNQNGVDRIRELLLDYYLTVNNDELKSVSESFFGMKNDEKIREIVRFINRYDLESIAAFLKLFEAEYEEVSRLLVDYESKKTQFLNTELKGIKKNENTEENIENTKTFNNLSVNKISEGLSERLLGFFEKIKNEEDEKLVLIVDETTEKILRKNNTLTYMQRYAEENAKKEEYEEFVNKLENVIESSLTDSYRKHHNGLKEYRKIESEIQELFKNEEISREFVEFLIHGNTQLSYEIIDNLKKTSMSEENIENFVSENVSKEKLKKLTDTELTQKLNESIFSTLRLLDYTVKNEVKERFSVAGQSTIYFKTKDNVMDKTESVNASSSEVLGEKDLLLTEIYKTDDIFATELLNEETENLFEDEDISYENNTKSFSTEEILNNSSVTDFDAENILNKKRLKEFDSEEALEKKHASLFSTDELLNEFYYDSTASRKATEILMNELLDKSPELTYLHEYAVETEKEEEFRALLRKIEDRFEEYLLKDKKKIIQGSKEITNKNLNDKADDDNMYSSSTEIKTEIQNILLDDILSREFIRHLQDRGETISHKITNEMTDKTIDKTTAETKNEAIMGAVTDESANNIINEVENKSIDEVKDEISTKSSKAIIERFETVNFKNMTEVGVASMISLTLERIFAGFETDFMAVISEKNKELTFEENKGQSLEIGIKSDAFIEKMLQESEELTFLQQYAVESGQVDEFKNLINQIEEKFKTDLQFEINHIQNDNLSVRDYQTQETYTVSNKEVRYDEQSDELLEKNYLKDNGIVYQYSDVKKEIQDLFINDEFSRKFIKYLMKNEDNIDRSWILQKKTEEGVIESTELKTAEKLGEYLVDILKNVQTETGKINIKDTNVVKTDIQDESQDEIQLNLISNIRYEKNEDTEYEIKNAVSAINRLSEEAVSEKTLTEKALSEKNSEENILTENITNKNILVENALSEYTISELILKEEALNKDSLFTYMKNYAVETNQEEQLSTFIEKIEDKLVKDTQYEERRRSIEKAEQENKKYQSDELIYNEASLRNEIRQLLENSEISKSFMKYLEKTEDAFLNDNVKTRQYITENEVTLTQITDLLEYRTDVQTYLRQNQTNYADDIKNSSYQSLIREDLSYQYVNSSEEYFENSRATGEIQYALQSVDTEKADSERVEKMLGDVKQKLEQVTRNVNTLNSAQSNMKEEFIRKQDIVSFRKELLNHLEEDISTAGKRQGILH